MGEGGKFQSTHPSGVRRHHVGRRRRAGPISIHAPQWGATVVNNGGALAMAFQSTHPSGVRLSILTYCYLTILFQSTHPSGVRLRLQKHFFSCPKYFNPRTPVGCDSTIRGRLMATWLFQSTHPSGVRQPFLPRVKMHVEISIHAPQWGATGRSGQAYDGELISIHAPQWGATRRNGAKAGQPAGFQSTHPSGVRRFPLVVALGRELFQSTHPSGVRRGFQAECGALHISIHAPQWGASAFSFLQGSSSRSFQSTHPSGVRRWPPRSRRRTVHFNPRTPVGCDSATHGSKTSDKISIHAPQWGATA